jgi:hypothetical protein
LASQEPEQSRQWHSIDRDREGDVPRGLAALLQSEESPAVGTASARKLQLELVVNAIGPMDDQALLGVVEGYEVVSTLCPVALRMALDNQRPQAPRLPFLGGDLPLASLDKPFSASKDHLPVWPQLVEGVRLGDPRKVCIPWPTGWARKVR